MKTEIENIIFYSGEYCLAGYEYHFHVGFNTRTEKYFKHTYKSNMFAGIRPLENSCKIENIRTSHEKMILECLYKKALIEEVLIQTSGIPDYCNVGDLVEVGNPRALKFKYEQFVIGKIDHKFFKGRYSGTTIISEDGRIHTNLKNIKVLEFSKANLEKMIFQLQIGDLKYQAI